MTYIAVDKRTRKYLSAGDQLWYGYTFVALVGPTKDSETKVLFEKPGHGHEVYSISPEQVGVSVVVYLPGDDQLNTELATAKPSLTNTDVGAMLSLAFGF